jgi:hypothetical protein
MAKRGNPGYKKVENIRVNIDKFSPIFWKLMGQFGEWFAMALSDSVNSLLISRLPMN